MKSKIVKAIIAVFFAVLATCAVCFMSACSRGGNNNKVTVTFVTNGGNEIAPITLKKGEKLTLPTAEKEGRVFADWYYDESFYERLSKKNNRRKERKALCPLRRGFNFCCRRRNGNRAANLL